MDMKELYWAAGFLEGEGSFTRCRAQFHLQCSQVEREPLERLQRLFGGHLYHVIRKNPKPNHQNFYRWCMFTNRAAAIAMTLYTLMSTKRKQQIEDTLANWKEGRVHYNKAKTHCQSGHEFTPENTYFYPNGRRECKTCSTAYKLKHRLRKQ